MFKHRFKNLKDYDTVKVYVYELEKLGFNKGPLLWDLKQRGEIWYDKQGNFKTLRDGPIDPAMLEHAKKNKVVVPLNSMHLWMREQLRFVDLVGVLRKDIPVYFKAFLDHRDKELNSFFSVDAFAGRVHSPIVNLKGNLRFKIRFYGKPVVSLDVKQMQPTILGKVLQDAIGKNSFSNAIDNGLDIYSHLQSTSGLESRESAKKYLFQLIFGKPMDDIGKMFKGESSDWVRWINSYKSQTENKNPHKEKMHSNLAWLLQYSEVQVMTGIWKKLMDKGVPFLTIHDEILCKTGDEGVVKNIMDEELKKHFSVYVVNVNKG